MRRTLPFVMGLLFAAGACSDTQVVVTMEIDVPNPEGEGSINQALSDIEVQLIPFDRDAVFDSMATAYGTPEPEVPEELIQQRNEVQAANETWQANVRRWQTIRDTLQALNTAMEQFSRGEARYVALFREWGDFDSQLGGVEREMNQSFEVFDSLQKATIRQSEEVGMMQENWADEAFQGVTDVFVAKQRASGLDILVDTTDASGVARTHLLAKPGQYWVHARYELAYTELYWNVPITVVRGEPMTVTLTRANAEERIKL